MGIGKKKQGTDSGKKDSEKNVSKIGAGKFWAWNSRAVSTTINTLILGYVTFYCTNQLMLSPLVVGIILMASRITDGVTDLFAGFIVDRTRTKLGKGRPYEICIIGLWACTLLLYSCPENLSTVLKYVWVFVMYFFVQSVFFTLLSAADIVYMVRAFRDEKQYATLNSMSGIIISMAGLFFNIAFPMMMAKLAVSAAGWRTMIAIWAIPCALIGMFRFFFVKETRDVDHETKNQKIEIKDIGTLLKANHHIYPVAIAILVTSFLANMGVGVYYYTYIIGDVGKMSLSAVASVACLPVLFVFPKLVGKMKVKDLMILGAAVGAAGYMIQFLAGSNLIVLILGAMIAGIGMLPFSYLVSLLVIDCATFNEWEKRPRMEGTLNTLVSIAKKGGSALGAGFSGAMLGLSGYNASLTVMPDSALWMIRILMGLVPAICYGIAILCLRLYHLDRMMPGIRKDLEQRRQEEANQGENKEEN
ncbi:MAG: MFS transporter [Lachnospiraceae bacterium]